MLELKPKETPASHFSPYKLQVANNTGCFPGGTKYATTDFRAFCTRLDHPERGLLGARGMAPKNPPKVQIDMHSHTV
jgi:hypothetical protein